MMSHPFWAPFAIVFCTNYVYLHKSKASGHVKRRQSNKSLQNPDILRLPNNIIRIAILVALAWLVRRRMDSVFCNPKNVSGTDCPIEGPCPNNQCHPDYSNILMSILTRFRPQRKDFWSSDFHQIHVVCQKSIFGKINVLPH